MLIGLRKLYPKFSFCGLVLMMSCLLVPCRCAPIGKMKAWISFFTRVGNSISSLDWYFGVEEKLLRGLHLVSFLLSGVSNKQTFFKYSLECI